MQIGQPSWSIESLDWTLDQSPECVSLLSPEGVGSLQVSCYQKRQGLVGSGDIARFREEARRDSGLEPIEGTFGGFAGLTVSHESSGRFWRRWWLWHGATSLFITYNCEAQEQEREALIVERLVASIQPCAAQQRVAPDKGRGGAADALR
jgi:hypothetical protein